MKLYRIANWAKHFENNRSKAVENTRWVPMPNRHDGENFTRIMRSKQGATVYAAWVLMVQVASKCEPRGTLAKTSGTPHDPVSLSLKTGAPESWFITALEFLEKETDWLDVQEVAGGRQADVSPTSGGCQATDVHLPRRKEGIEGNGMEENGTASAGRFAPPTREQLNLEAAKIGLPEIEVDKFVSYYGANGWKVGKNQMKSWSHALAGWAARWRENYGSNATRQRPGGPDLNAHVSGAGDRYHERREQWAHEDPDVPPPGFDREPDLALQGLRPDGDAPKG